MNRVVISKIKQIWRSEFMITVLNSNRLLILVSIDKNDVDDDSFIDVQSDDSDSSIDSEAAFKALSMQRFVSYFSRGFHCIIIS